MRGSTWLLVLGLLSMACGVPAGSFEPSGLAPPGGGLTLVTEPTATRGLTWSNLRADGEQLTVDLVATESLNDVYGLALRLHLTGATFVKAEAAEAWPLFRAERGALVFSARGAGAGRVVRGGRVATVWLSPSAAAGRIELDLSRSALVGADGASRQVSMGAARWSR